jgi:hypothetical protein
MPSGETPALRGILCRNDDANDDVDPSKKAPHMGGSIGMLLCTYGLTCTSLASITIGSKRVVDSH